MSLRTRLVAVLLVLAAVGLLTLAAVTYATQRSFLLDRIDEQTRAAEPAIGRLLAESAGGLSLGFPGRRPRGFRLGGRGGGGGSRPGGPPEASLPPGTYGERRSRAGLRVGDPVVLSYAQQASGAPELPGRLRPGRLFTADAQGGEGPQYRVRVLRAPLGAGLTVVAIPLGGVEETLNRLLRVEALVIAGVLLLLAGLSWVLVGVGLRPLEGIGHTADAIAGGDLSRRVDVTNPRTEVGHLGLALNAMLGRLERAFAEREASEGRLRQFLSDASHELRTPLASIRGYAELFRIGAAQEPEDRAKALRRIEDEAARMGVLVEDLLTLARLDEVRDVLAEPVDAAGMVDDAVADARAVDPQRPIHARVDDETFVLGDPDQLRQVLANLLRNALVHTPPGTPVEVALRRSGQHAEFTVRDHGPGLPTEDPDALFGRFWRAEGGRERGRAGAGLGLAIVAGIVAAHGGEVGAASVPGGGAEFVVRLRLADARVGQPSL